MDVDTFAACLRTPGGIEGIAQALLSHLQGSPAAELLPALAEALLHPGRPMPEAAQLGPLGREYLDAFPALRDLVDWDACRLHPNRARRHLVSPASHDSLVAMRPLDDWSAITFLTHAALSLIRPTKLAAVVVTMRDDGISILEWIAHYRAIGFQGIFVYSNDNADGSDELLHALAAHGVITFIENTTSGSVYPQQKAFSHSLHFLPELRDFEWVFYADSDEFLVPGSEFDWQVPPVLSRIAEQYGEQLPSAICYHWRWFVSNYAVTRNEQLLLERFTHARPHELLKSVVRIGNVLCMRILHFPELVEDGYFVDPALNVIPGSKGRDKKAVWLHRPDGYVGGQLNHYWCKSFEEYLIKKRRGDLVMLDQQSSYHRDLDTFFLWNGYEQPENAVPPPSQLLARVRAELKALRDLSGIRHLEAKVNDGFRRLLVGIGDSRNVRDLYDEIARRSSVSAQTGQALAADHKGAWYHDVLKHLHEALQPAAYFEIGTLDGATLALAACPSIAVDPAFRVKRNIIGSKRMCHLYQLTSDDFFAAHNPRKILARPIDLAFLDGMHEFEFLLRDFINTEPHCHRGTVIVLHDCLPTDAYVARREADDRSNVDLSPHKDWWAGDVWKVLLILKKYRPDLNILCVDAAPTGLVLISNLDPASTRLRLAYDDIVSEFAELRLIEYSVARLFHEAAIQPTDLLWKETFGGAHSAGSPANSRPALDGTIATAPGVSERTMQNHGRRIISLSMVKNEQDIIEPFIRHNARFVDFMIILDNASLDETRRIALDCARELGTIIVADSEEFGYTQAERMTRLLHYCQTAFFADFVLLLDADEFIGSADRQTLELALDRIPQGGAGLIPWRTFVLTPEDVVRATEDPPRSMRWRRTTESPVFEKIVLRLDGVNRPHISIGQGSHWARAADGAALPAIQLEGIELLHFPVRSRNQFVAKSVVGWMAYLVKDPDARKKVYGRHWQMAFDRIAHASAMPSDEEVCEISMCYAQTRARVEWRADAVEEEPPFDYSRRYSKGDFADPIALIARSWERSLLRLPPLVKLERPPVTASVPAVAATAFDADWHWDHLYVDVAPFRYIAEMHRPATVLDIGCGVGAYLAVFKALDTQTVLGVDGLPAEATVLRNGEYTARDLAQPMDLARLFDVVVCVGVAQRLDAEHGEVLLDNITRHAGGLIVFSAAEPGQWGPRNINCRPIAYWLECWAARGWVPDLTASLGMRCLATLSWFRRNLVVLRRGALSEGVKANAALTEIGARPFVWYGQLPGVRFMPFTEPLPRPPSGYVAS
jgi:SAM-dependent methyltransferase